MDLQRRERVERLKELLKKKILVLDGAMGTALQCTQLSEEDFGGAQYEGCNEHLVLTRPEIVENIHRTYLRAGSDIIETNTFGGTSLVLGEFDLSDRAYEINFGAAQLARRAADAISTSDAPRFVAGSMGPTTKSLSVTGGATFEELSREFYFQSKALVEGGVDYLLIETSQDSRNIKAALNGIDRLFAEIGDEVPIAISGTIEAMGTMLAGQSVEAFVASFSHRDLLYIGLNCATGPDFMTDHIRSLSMLSPFPVACVPNAGLPDEDGNYLETPAMIARVLSRFAKSGWVNLLGGCCGTRADHIEAIAEVAKQFSPRPLNQGNRGSFLSGVDFLEVDDDHRPLLVGERTNVIGSKKFKDLICDEKFDEAAEIAKSQAKKGAHIIDVCLANPDRDELKDTEEFLKQVVKKVRAPLMIDSTDEQVIQRALTYCQGKSIINSINLEDGEERFSKIVPLARKYGAALVVGTIDDDPQQGMAIGRERKLAVAERSFELLTSKYQVPPEDIYWDPLVFPCATGDAQYIGSAVETIEGLRLIKERFSQTKSVLGISNVSFGLPPAGREVLNSVFLYHCVQAGLDLAIVNTEKLVRYSSISKEELQLAEDLLFHRGTDPIGTFTAYFRQKTGGHQKRTNEESLSLEQRLANCVVEGSKEGLIADLNLALKNYAPLDIINGPLMDGMNEVGKLFNQNKLIVAEVLQSAEVMKASVDHLNQFMTKNEAATRGKMLLATVKGDVHDIGKNLVDIILSNNGFEVIDLGIKVAPETLVEGVRKHSPHIVGLSGLLVKSAHQMIATAQDLSQAQIRIPMMVGGAALTAKFTETRISPSYQGSCLYAKDAMTALDLAKQLMESGDLAASETTSSKPTEELAASEIKVELSEQNRQRALTVPVVSSPPEPSDYDEHILHNTPIDLIWKFINPQMLYGRHLGIKGSIVKKLAEIGHNQKRKEELLKEAPKAVEIWSLTQSVMKEYRNTTFMKPAAIYRHFPAWSDGNKIHLYENPRRLNQAISTFEFRRQRDGEQLCLSDYINPRGAPIDNVAFFVVSVGVGVASEAMRLRQKGEYLKSIILQVLAIESAEAYAEYIHALIRKFWNISDSPEFTMTDLFRANYQGRRFSFGYPACPDLEHQKILFELLKPERIGVELTEGYMMDPEASVSALVFHHKDSKYFAV